MRNLSPILAMASAMVIGACAGAPGDETDGAVSTTSHAAMGINAMGINAMGINAMGINAMGINAMGINSLAPSAVSGTSSGIYPAKDGVSYLLIGGKNPAMEKWMGSSPADAAMFLEYFARCALPVKTQLGYSVAGGLPKTWYPGRYGLAAGMLAKQPADMSADESLWVSSCLLAHINLFGTHQYISLRGNPPNREAMAALKPTAFEVLAMQPASVFFGDIFGWRGQQYRYAAVHNPFLQAPGTFYPDRFNVSAPTATPAQDVGPANPLDEVLGRKCDWETCWFFNLSQPAGGYDIAIENSWLINGAGTANYPFKLTPGLGVRLRGVKSDPEFNFDAIEVAGHYAPDGRWMPLGAFRPIFVGMPVMSNVEPPVTTVNGVKSWSTTQTNPGVSYPGSLAINFATQIKSCQKSGGIATCLGDPLLQGSIVNLTEGQKILVSRRTETNGSPSKLTADLTFRLDGTEAYTALIRYANPMATPARAQVLVSSDPMGRSQALSVRTTDWPSTLGTPTRYGWLQIYPAYPYRTNPAVNQQVGVDVQINGAVAALAPEIDAVTFIPGPPQCMPAGATSFASVCP